MIRPFAFLAALALSGSACADSEPTIAYQYVVRGHGEKVAITFLTEDQGLIDGEVSLPWTGEEFEGTNQSRVRLEADGPPGSRVKCVVRYRPIGGRYGGDGSGELSQNASSPNEDQTVCALNQDQISPGS